MDKKLSSNLDMQKFEFFGDFYKGIARAKINGKWGLVNQKGEQITPFEFEEIVSLSYSRGLYGIKKNGKWGFIDRNGECVTEAKYDAIFPFYGNFGISKVQKNHRWGLIDKNGKNLTNISYAKVELFGKGFLLVELNGKLEYFSVEEFQYQYRKKK